MVVEYAPFGNLRNFLRERRPKADGYEQPIGDTNIEPLKYRDLVSFTYQIARGMDYLSSKQVRVKPAVHYTHT